MIEPSKSCRPVGEPHRPLPTRRAITILNRKMTPTHLSKVLRDIGDEEGARSRPLEADIGDDVVPTLRSGFTLTRVQSKWFVELRVIDTRTLRNACLYCSELGEDASSGVTRRSPVGLPPIEE
jgi:hypothetical protein